MADSTPYLQPAYVYKGEDAVLTVTMSPVIDITGWAIAFTIRPSKEGDAALTLTKTVGSGIVLSDPTNGEFTINLGSEDTDTLTVGPYSYDVWRVDLNNTYPLIEPSLFRVYAPVYHVGQ